MCRDAHCLNVVEISRLRIFKRYLLQLASWPGLYEDAAMRESSIKAWCDWFKNRAESELMAFWQRRTAACVRRFPLWKQHKPKFADRAHRASAGAPCALDACSARAIVNNPWYYYVCITCDFCSTWICCKLLRISAKSRHKWVYLLDTYRKVM